MIVRRHRLIAVLGCERLSATNIPEIKINDEVVDIDAGASRLRLINLQNVRAIRRDRCKRKRNTKKGPSA